MIDDTIYSFELTYADQYTEVVYASAKRKNEEPTAELEILKVDYQTGKVPQGDGILENAEYYLYADEDIYNVAKTLKYFSKGDLVAIRTTAKDGTTEKINNIPLGKYKLKEEKSSEGYLLDTQEYAIDFEYKDQNTKVISKTVISKEVVKKMQVHIFKSGIDVQSGVVEGLEGVEFTIKLAREVEEAYSKGYAYEEIWNGIDQNGNKVNVDTKRVAEAQEIAPTYDTLITDENGDGYSSKLAYGRYIGKETKTPKDFETASDFYFSISQDESEVEDIAKKVKHIYINNEQLETYIKLVKKDKTTEKIVSASSATFKIKATEDIVDRGNNKVLYKKGEVITQKIGSTTYSSFTTNANNIVVPDGSYNSNNDDKGSVITPLLLPVGSYEISEVRVPEGFLQLEEPVTFKIEGIRDYDKDQDGDYIKEVVVKNEQPTGTLIVDKYIALREEIDTSLVDISDLSGIEFTLIAKENIIDMADGSIIYEKGKEVKKANLNKEGFLQITNLPLGIYELYESKTINGLATNNTRYEVKFTQEDLITKVYESTVDVINDTTVVEFSKKSITGDEEISGAKLTIVDDNENIIDTWISTENTHKIEGLIVGKTYTLIEEIAPEGYTISTDIEFTVDENKETQKIEMIDKVVLISKTDLVTGEELPGAKLVVTDKDENIVDEWISTDEPHHISGLVEGEEYTLTEITSPYGYELAESITFKVTEDKETQLIEIKDMPILTNIKVVKMDSDTGEAIKSKFKFAIYEDQECTRLIKEVESNIENGTVEFEDLRYGTYFIKEIEAPSGYYLSEEIVKIDINEDGVFINGEKIEETDEAYSFNFYDTLIPTIQTGTEVNNILLLALMGISLMGITFGIVIMKKKKY